MRYHHQRSVKPGTRPGALGEVESQINNIRLMDYDADSIVEETFQSLAEVLDYGKSPRTTWVHVQGAAGADELRLLREAYGMHPLAVEDVMNIGQRPKFEPYDAQVFLVDVVPMRENRGMAFEQVSIFIGPTYVISFHAGDDDVFAAVRARIHEGKGRIRSGGADYLAYALADVIVDHGFPVLESYAEELEALEDAVFEDRAPDPVKEIHQIRRDLTALRRMVWHQTQMLADLLDEEHPLVQPETMPYFRDAADHSQRVLDLLETYRDMSSSLLDTHLSLVSMRMNDVMKVLTIIATIFIPLSFIVGMYGMNFDPEVSPWNMPELKTPYGYVTLLGIMAVIVTGMLYLFRRKKWL
ncbi:MAG: magnesium/cobalt transporter CorA [Nevskiales bacterium]